MAAVESSLKNLKTDYIGNDVNCSSSDFLYLDLYQVCNYIQRFFNSLTQLQTRYIHGTLKLQSKRPFEH